MKHHVVSSEFLDHECRELSEAGDLQRVYASGPDDQTRQGARSPLPHWQALRGGRLDSVRKIAFRPIGD
jgi:hypothetical protein